MKKIDLPAMPFYIGDWRKSPEVQVMTLEQRGAWFEMLCYMWESVERGVLVNANRIPYTDEQICRMVSGLSLSILKEIEDTGVFSRREDGAIYCRRTTREEEIKKIRSKSGSIGGKKTSSKYFATAKKQQITEDENENENEFSSSCFSHVFLEQSDDQIPGSATTVRHGERKLETAAAWRVAFEDYTVEHDRAYSRLLNNGDWLEKMKHLNPDLDVKLSMENAREFWASKEGWKHKKSRKSKELDWESTYRNAIRQPMNRVFSKQFQSKISDHMERKRAGEIPQTITDVPMFDFGGAL